MRIDRPKAWALVKDAIIVGLLALIAVIVYFAYCRVDELVCQMLPILRKLPI